jgi:hypothetical protein
MDTPQVVLSPELREKLGVALDMLHAVLPSVAGPLVQDTPEAADVAALADTLKPPLASGGAVQAAPGLVGDTAVPFLGAAGPVNVQAAAVQAGTAIGQALAPLAGPLLARSRHRLASRKLWVAIGTIASLAAQAPLGLNLHPAAQVAIAALAAVYVAAQAGVDGKTKGVADG